MTTTAAVQGDTITVTARGVTVELTVNEWATDDDGVERPRWIARELGGEWFPYNADDGCTTMVSDDDAVHEAVERALRAAIVEAYRAAREDAKKKLAAVRFAHGPWWSEHASSELVTEVRCAQEWESALEWIEPSERRLAADAAIAAAEAMPMAAE